MALENIRKRKYEDENRNFQEKWVENYGLIDKNGKLLSLICNITIIKCKVSNLRRQYVTNFEFGCLRVALYRILKTLLNPS